MGMFQFIKSSLKQLDMFGYPATLMTDQENEHKTKLSGLISISLLAVLSFLFRDNVIQYLTKQNVYSSMSQSFNLNPAEILMTKDNFMFAISLDQTDFIFNERPYFNVTLSQKIQKRDHLGVQQKNVTYLLMEPCRLEKFQTIFGAHGQDFKEQYDRLKFNQWLCPEDNYQIRLAGTHANNLFEYMKIEISQCNNDTLNNLNSTQVNPKNGLWNPICAPSESVKNVSIFGLSIYTTDYVVNIQDSTESFITPFLSDELYFNFNPKELFKSVDIYYRQQDVNTDVGIIYGSEFENETLIYKEYKDYNERVDVLQRDYFSAFYFRRSYYTIQSQRTFQKLQDLLSFLGGLTGILLPLFTAILKFYNRYDFIIHLANKIYDFDLNDDKFNNRRQERYELTPSISPLDLYNQPDSSLNSPISLEIFENIQKLDKKKKKKKIVYKTDNNTANNKISQVEIIPKDIHCSFNETDQAFQKPQQNQQSIQLDTFIPQNNDALKEHNETIFVTKNDQNDIILQDQLQNPSQTTQINIKLQTKRYKNINPIGKFYSIPDKSENLIDINEIQGNIIKKAEPSISHVGVNIFQKVKTNLLAVITMTKMNRSETNIIKMAFGKLFTNFKMIEYSPQWIINCLTFGMCCNNRYTQLTNKAIQQIYSDLDVLTLIKKHQELNKLKTVILQQNQLLLINVQPKKLLQLDDQQAIDLHSLKNITLKQKPTAKNNMEEEYHQIKQAYQWCLEECEKSDEFQFNVNNKLIDALGNQLRQDMAKIK